MNETPRHNLIHAAAGPRREGLTAAELVQQVFRFLRVILCRVEVLIICVVVALLLGGLRYATTEPIYQSTGEILVLQSGQQQDTADIAGGHAAAEYMATYRHWVCSDEVLAGAIERIPAEHRVDFEGMPPHVWPKALARNLTVDTISGTLVLTISYKSKSPDAAKVVVDAVMSSYVESMQELHRTTSETIYQREEKLKESLLIEKAQREQQLVALEQVQGDGADVLITDGNQINAAERRAWSLNEAYTQAHQRRLDHETQYRSIRTAIANGEGLQQHVFALADSVGREVLMQRLGLSGQDAYARANLSRQMLEDEARLRTLAEEGYGENHSKVAEIRNRIAVTRQYLENREHAVAARLRQMTNEELAPTLEDMAYQRLQQSLTHEQALLQSYNEERSRVIALNNQASQLRTVRSSLDSLKGELAAVNERLRAVQIKRDGSLVRATKRSHPERPSGPIAPNLKSTLSLSLAVGLILGVAIIFVIDLLDDRFRSPEEMQSQLGTPILAMVPRLESLDGKATEAVHVLALPTGVETETFRTLRTTLAFQDSGAQRLVVSSTEPGDGKTTISSNLAAAIAQSGKRTLLIDADLRRPGLTALLDLKGTKGLSAILRDVDVPLDDSIHGNLVTGVAPNLDVIPSGPRPANPIEMLSGERLADLLGWADSLYDQVVIDCPPSLAVSDPAIVGRLVDGLVLVVRPEKNRRHAVTRAVTTLQSLGVHVLGLVINHVETSAGYAAYRYGGYDYDYAYDHHADEFEDDMDLSDAPDDARTDVTLSDVPESDAA